MPIPLFRANPFLKHTVCALAGLCALAVAPPLAAQPVAQGPANVPHFEPAFKGQTRAPAIITAQPLQTEVVADGLNHPWGIDLLPEGGYLVTERSGKLRHISPDGTVSRPIKGLPLILARGQGGLLDVKVGPSFSTDRLIYWTYSKPVGGGSVTAAARGRLAEDFSRVTEVEDIFKQSPAAESPGHYGSRIVFEGDHVFITTGDRQQFSNLAQSLNNTIGTVVRVLNDGRITTGNPFVGLDDANPAIWTYGHRNIQGAVIHPQTGVLWTIEHGPAGGDELNRITKGTNYGWPTISYGEDYSGAPVGGGITTAPGLEQPVYYWDPVIAPGDLTVYTGRLFKEWSGDFLIASLRPGGVVRLKMKDGRVIGEERLLTTLGRVRDVQMDTDGSLLVLTDRRRGAVLRVTPGG